ncbi:MAG: hypothetical protein JXX29_19675 [Deltaproteobacteria bacterium]|nr:hypothetical protein [Deltaproteobacteria bacterium]MBN2673910.1 hypothetical protein [Deltaproteobacteria bacterium]
MNTNNKSFMNLTMAMVAALIFLPAVCMAGSDGNKTMSIQSVVVYPPESVGVSEEISDVITVALVTEFEQRGILVHDYRPVFTEMAEAAQSETAFVLTDEVKHKITETLKAKKYVDGRLYQLGNEMRFSIALRRSNGSLVVSRTITLADENDLPIAVRRLVESLLSGKKVEDTLTLNNATKGETRNQPNRMNLEVYTGVMFGMSIGVGDMNSHPLVIFDNRFELNQVMIQFDLGIGIHGSATFGDATIAANYYLSKGSIAPYLGLGGGVFLGDKWAEDGSMDDASGVFGGHFFPQVGVEFLRAAAIHVHADVRYTGNASGDEFGHGPSILLGMGF